MILSNAKWLVGLGLVFVLILATNMVDRSSFTKVNQSVVALYEDRLVAGGLVFQMHTRLTDKKVALAAVDVAYFAAAYRDDVAAMQGYIDAFAETQLTSDEERTFESLQRNVATLEQLEDELARDPARIETDHAAVKELSRAFDAIDADLVELASTQLSEGKVQVAAASKAMKAVDMLTRLELFFLVAIAAALQFLLLYRPKNAPSETA
jgi:hypothetical protein